MSCEPDFIRAVVSVFYDEVDFSALVVDDLGHDGVTAMVLDGSVVVDGLDLGHRLQVGDGRVHGSPAQGGERLGRLDPTHTRQEAFHVSHHLGGVRLRPLVRARTQHILDVGILSEKR